MKWLLIANSLFLIVNLVMVGIIGFTKRTNIYMITDVYKSDSTIAELNKQQGILESALINLQKIYWNSHKQDRKYLLPYVKLFCSDKASQKLTTEIELK